MSPTQIATETVQGTPSGKQPVSTSVTPPANTQQYNEGDVFKATNSPTVYVVRGGKYQAISGQNVSDKQFKELTGKSFTDVKTISSLANMTLPKGEDIIVPTLKPVSQVIGRRPSAANPKMNEYYNTTTGKGFAKEPELFGFLNTQGYTYKDFNSLNQALDKNL
jgi:hypothetical protein